MRRKIIGLIEKVRINGKTVLAKIDTGAKRSSIDIELASELKLGPIFKSVKIVSADGSEIRPVVKAEIYIKGTKIESSFNIANRKRLKYPILIGREDIKENFLIDPSKNEVSHNKPRK